MPVTIDVCNGRLPDQACDAIIVTLFEGERELPGAGADVNEALGGAISQLIEAGDIKGKRGELTTIHTFGRLSSPRVVVAGLGKRGDISVDAVRALSANVARYLRQHGVHSAATGPHGVASGLDPERVGQAVAEGTGLGLYRFTRHKSKVENDGEIQSLTVVIRGNGPIEQIQRGISTGEVLAEAANLARDMANEPSNYMTPTELASRARAVADETGLECQILDRDDMVELGMGALLGVAKGSHEEPKFIVLSYRGAPATDRAIGLLGKGVTFDTGGISIKPAAGMEEMKGDMSGGASVIAALKAIALLKPAVNVTGIVPATENMPGGDAIKPGDVLVAMNGKTIEVINTDAEGRLILADAICYARKLELSPLVDVATLTGAISVALGDVAAGVIGNDQDLVNQVIGAGKDSGEKMWQLPLFDEYREQIKSDVADIKNTGGRKAGSITAAWFLAEFAESTPWAHIDMAGVDTYDHERGWIVKGASGIPVRTLVNIVLQHAGQQTSNATETDTVLAG